MKAAREILADPAAYEAQGASAMLEEPDEAYDEDLEADDGTADEE